MIKTFLNLVAYYNEQGLTVISQIRLDSAVIEGIGYEVHRYINTGLLPFEEFSEERPWTDEEEWGALTCGILDKWVSLGIRREIR